MIINLIKPHEKQREIVEACLDKDIFFIVSIIGRQFGKTTIAENMAIYWALNNSNSVVYWVSPTDSQAQKVYKDIVVAIIESGIVKSKKMPKGDTEITFINGSKILFRSAASEDSLRGQSVDYLILDEAAFIKRDTVEQILLPMLNVRGKKALFISTPKGKNYLYDYYLKGQNTPRWKSLRYSTYDSPLANKELIDVFKETLSPKLFKQEIEAEFVDSSSLFNNLSEVMCLDKLEEPVINEITRPNRRNSETIRGKYWAGIDVGLINDATVLSIIDDEGNLVNYYRWEKVEAPELIKNIIDINNKWKFERIMIENNNQGLVLYQELKRKLSNIRDFNTNSKTKPEIINRLVHLFNMKEIKLVKDGRQWIS